MKKDFTTEEAAKILGIAKRTLYSWIQGDDPKMKAHRRGDSQRKYISREELEEALGRPLTVEELGGGNGGGGQVAPAVAVDHLERLAQAMERQAVALEETNQLLRQLVTTSPTPTARPQEPRRTKPKKKARCEKTR